MFERFVSLDGRGGSGLGLPIGRALATAMGGGLDYDEGFVLTLPVWAGIEDGDTDDGGTYASAPAGPSASTPAEPRDPAA